MEPRRSPCGIAVLIAAWNAERTVGRAIRSALAQPEVSEVCVVDDASDDQTSVEAEGSDDGSSRLKVLRLPTNSGPAVARNVAIASTASPWLTVLDADDYLLAGRLGRLLAVSAGVDFLGDALIRAETGAEPHSFETGDLSLRALTLETFALGNLGRVGGSLDLGFLKPLIRREALVRNNIHYNPRLRLGEDYDLYLRLLASGARARLTSPAGYVSVFTHNSLSCDHTIEDLERLRDCDLDVELDPHRSARERRALRLRRRGVDCRLQWRLLIEAVKARNITAAAQTFHGPFVSAYLGSQLLEQLWLRSVRTSNRQLQGPYGVGVVT